MNVFSTIHRIVITGKLQGNMRCDLHVHTRHSGMCNVPVPLMGLICRECYSHPDAVYETLKDRGMDFVTVTDHDSIDAVERLRHHADFFLSEEVSCITPSGTEIHVGVYGIEERHHLELQERRSDVPRLAAYLREQKLFFSINHVFSSLTGRRTELDFDLFEAEFPAVETLNGHIPRVNNDLANRLAKDWRKAAVGGSDAHTLSTLGLTFTEVPGAQGLEEFLEGLRHGHGRPAGTCGNYGKLTRAVLEIGWGLVEEKLWPIVLAPLFAAVPAVTLVNYACEFAFQQKWSRRLWPVNLPVANEPAAD